MFVDSAKIFCYAGKGGKGCNSFDRSKSVIHPRPTGGDGGKGGSVVLVARKQVRTLLDLQMRKTFKAEEGVIGGAKNMAGKDAEELIINVPMGTEVYDEATGHLLKDLTEENERLVVCRGGDCGKGNHKHSLATEGEAGETRTVRLELKVIADVGLIGFPNAGKSTLISHISNAKSKIAAYPFTTKEPILGVVKRDDDAIVIADIPGLIEGAHEGRGLGHRFLRHIERTRLFVHLVDMAAVDGRDPVEDYRVICEELAGYSEVFLERPMIVAANKMDVPEAAENLVKFKRKVKVPVIEISAVTGQGLTELVNCILLKLRDNAEV